MNHSITHNTAPPKRGGAVMLRHCYGCYETCYAVRELRLRLKE